MNADVGKGPHPGVDLVVRIALLAVMTSLVLMATYLFIFPIPATQGYFNFGDIMIFVTALTFGPAIGGFAGGVGSSLSDFFGGFTIFAPFTLVVKGLEGVTAGFIAQRRFRGSSFAAWVIAGSVMVGGYFLTESFLIALVYGASETTGVIAALSEVPFNMLQVFAGGLVGIPVSRFLKQALRSYVLPGNPRVPTSAEKKN